VLESESLVCEQKELWVGVGRSGLGVLFLCSLLECVVVEVCWCSYVLKSERHVNKKSHRWRLGVLEWMSPSFVLVSVLQSDMLLKG